MNMCAEITLLDEILAPYKTQIGEDYLAYKNHVLRMLNICFYLANPDQQQTQKLIIAAAFHDIGLWTNNTVDYLPPSLIHAERYLQQQNLGEWSEEIALIIDQHHKVRAFTDPRYPLVEYFRQADLVDFSLGLVKHGVPVNFIKQLKQTLPNHGFHKMLLRRTWQRIKQQPFSPAPMMKW
ncbi:phosphohydrolase [Agarivorans sp. Toyoura001]|uniref:HD domain-containing protein n=1 Tax=Agarivorans sp. Toyoura001 TaxID=2283141 RepID=UPI0010EE0F7C|nr:HD domain-containing protein [Agarivorans sp. Toyoura001]GDY24841.1 phosphohydrolase [Agarivorans sp. Toyoura001]